MAESVTEDRGPQIRAVTYSMLVVATAAVALRFWARSVAPKAGFWWDDWLSLAALPFVWASCGLSIYKVSIGLGRHINQVPRPHSQLGLLLFIDNFAYILSLSLVKLSVLLFYIRVFHPIRAYRIAFWITGAILVGWGVAISFLALFACVPVQKFWISTTSGHCLNKQQIFLGAAISNIIADLIVLLLPIPMLWQLHIGTPRRLGLVGVFATGYCVIILSILRLASVVDLGHKLQGDISWNLAYPQMLVTSEMSVALLSSCLPSLFNLVKHGIRRHSSKMFKETNALKPLSGPAGSRIGPIGNPIDEPRKSGFLKLQSGKQNTRMSDERLFNNTSGTEHYTTAFPTKASRDMDPELRIPLHQIHVREDLMIDTHRPLGFEMV